MWHESLRSQLRWKFYNKLFEIVKPSPADWRNLTVVNSLVATDPPNQTEPSESAQSVDRSEDKA